MNEAARRGLHAGILGVLAASHLLTAIPWVAYAASAWLYLARGGFPQPPGWLDAVADLGGFLAQAALVLLVLAVVTWTMPRGRRWLIPLALACLLAARWLPPSMPAPDQAWPDAWGWARVALSAAAVGLLAWPSRAAVILGAVGASLPVLGRVAMQAAADAYVRASAATAAEGGMAAPPPWALQGTAFALFALGGLVTAAALALALRDALREDEAPSAAAEAPAPG